MCSTTESVVPCLVQGEALECEEELEVQVAHKLELEGRHLHRLLREGGWWCLARLGVETTMQGVVREEVIGERDKTEVWWESLDSFYISANL